MAKQQYVTIDHQWVPLAGGNGAGSSGGGSTILDGTGPPDNDLGALGNYYLDTDAHILYGPKQEGLEGLQTLFEDQVPAIDMADASGVVGIEIVFNVPGRVVGMRHFSGSFTPPGVESTQMILYSGDGEEILANITIEDEVETSRWYAGEIYPPVQVSPGQTLLVTLGANNHGIGIEYSEDDPLPPLNNGGMTTTRGVSGEGGPDNFDDGLRIYVDAVFEASVWPVALSSGEGVFLPLTGGTVTGNLTVRQVLEDDTIGASGGIEHFTGIGEGLTDQIEGTLEWEGTTSRFEIGGYVTDAGKAWVKASTDVEISSGEAELIVGTTPEGVDSIRLAAQNVVSLQAQAGIGLFVGEVGIGLELADGDGALQLSSGDISLRTANSVQFSDFEDGPIRLSGVDDPVDPTDAVNKQTLDYSVASVHTLPSRDTASTTTASLAPDESQSVTIYIAPGYRLYTMSASRPARVRLYATAALRDADVARPIGTAPTGNHGVIFDFVAPDTSTMYLSPLVDGYDDKATPDGGISARITNLDSSAGTVAVTFLYLPTEYQYPL